MKNSNGCGCGASGKGDKKDLNVKKNATEKNKELVADANAIVENMEGYTMKERNQKKQEVKDAFKDTDKATGNEATYGNEGLKDMSDDDAGRSC